MSGLLSAGWVVREVPVQANGAGVAGDDTGFRDSHRLQNARRIQSYRPRIDCWLSERASSLAWGLDRATSCPNESSSSMKLPVRCRVELE